MIHGVDYLCSDEKRDFDRRVAIGLQPLSIFARIGARATFGCELYTDKRIGQDGRLSETSKIKTLSDETGEPINRFARIFRAIGLDETLQFDEVSHGTLSIVGRRRLIPNEYDRLRDIAKSTVQGRALLDEWDEVVLPYPCGLLSSNGLEGRELGSRSVERRLQLDIHDSHDASRRHDVGLIILAMKMLAVGKMKHSSLPIDY